MTDPLFLAIVAIIALVACWLLVAAGRDEMDEQLTCRGCAETFPDRAALVAHQNWGECDMTAFDRAEYQRAADNARQAHAMASGPGTSTPTRTQTDAEWDALYDALGKIEVQLGEIGTLDTRTYARHKP
jgi:hypothetical protein